MCLRTGGTTVRQLGVSQWRNCSEAASCSEYCPTLLGWTQRQPGSARRGNGIRTLFTETNESTESVRIRTDDREAQFELGEVHLLLGDTTSARMQESTLAAPDCELARELQFAIGRAA